MFGLHRLPDSPDDIDETVEENAPEKQEQKLTTFGRPPTNIEKLLENINAPAPIVGDIEDAVVVPVGEEFGILANGYILGNAMMEDGPYSLWLEVTPELMAEYNIVIPEGSEDNPSGAPQGQLPSADVEQPPMSARVARAEGYDV